MIEILTFWDSDKNTDLGIMIKLNVSVCKRKLIFFLDSDQPDLSEASLSYVVVLCLKKCLKEVVLLSTQNTVFNRWVRK